MNTSALSPGAAIAGRGASINPPNRFERLHIEAAPEFSHDCPDDERPSPRTQFFHDATESLLTKNDSPDVGFAYGFNCYRGCEHVILLTHNCSPWP